MPPSLKAVGKTVSKAQTMGSLINFGGLEDVLKNVSDQQATIMDTLEQLRADVDDLAPRDGLEKMQKRLDEGRLPGAGGGRNQK